MDAQELVRANRGGCTFATVGSHTYFPLWPSYGLSFEGREEDDEGEGKALPPSRETGEL